jgi:transmembrane sensor
VVKIGSGNGDEVEAEATTWAVLAAERPLDDSEQQRLDDWLAASSRNLGAFVRAQAIWSDVDRVAALGERTQPEAAEPQRPVRWRYYAMAASLLVAMIGGGTAYDRLAGRVSTGRTEVRELVLEDGSRITLNGDSAVQVRYAAGERRVILRRGEASFSVAHDSARPFYVSAGDVTARAVGTRFSVGMEDDDVDVTVEEGIVSVADDDGAPPRLIHRNEEFVAAPTGSRRAVLDTGEVERRLAWRRGLLIFDGESLRTASARVNRYSAVPVVIDDPTLARAEFVGVFRIGDGRAFASAVAQAFNGVVVERSDGLHLMRQQNSPSH